MTSLSHLQVGELPTEHICQEVCPIGKKGWVPSTEPTFQPRPAVTGQKLVDLLSMTEAQFRERFKNSPVKRAKWRGLMRNVAAALSSSDEKGVEIALKEEACKHPEPLVREQALMSLDLIQRRKQRSGS